MTSKSVEPSFGQLPENMSFQELMDAGVIEISEIDDLLAVNQAELVDVPFIMFSWEIKVSQSFGGTYALVKVKTQEGTRVFADGGTGIGEALERYKNKLLDSGEDAFSPIYFPHGLRVSQYQKELTDADGTTKMIPASTYYFDNRTA